MLTGIKLAQWIVANQEKYREGLREQGYAEWQIDQYIQYAQEWVDTGIQPSWNPDVTPPTPPPDVPPVLPEDGIPSLPGSSTDWKRVALITGVVAGAILLVVVIYMLMRRG